MEGEQKMGDATERAGKKSVVAVIHRDTLPGFAGDDSDVMTHKPETVAEVEKMIEEAFDKSIGGVKNLIKPGQRVFVKPNCFANVEPNSYASMDPRTMEAVCRVIKKAVPDCYLQVGDAPSLGQILGESREAMKNTKIEEASLRGGADEIVYLDETSRKIIDVPEGKAVHQAEVYEPLVEADVLINMPKMKTHIEGYVTMALKNWNGCVYYTHSRPYGYDHSSMQGAHRSDLGQKMVDLHKALPAQFTLLDGLIGMEGQGPHAGVRVDMKCIIASTDPVATDAVGCHLMGIDPFEVPAIRIAHHEGLGTAEMADITVEGANIEGIKRYFKRPVGDPAGVVPGVDVYEAGACPGCMAMIRGALDGFKGSGKTVNNVGILAGWNTLPPKRDYDLFLTVGDCWKTGPTTPGVQEYLNDLKSKGTTVKELPGCSPVYVFVEIGNILDKYASG
jgi:uncharacterized protein (DUF362 family)